MSDRFPSLFVSHGAPSLIIEECPARQFFIDLGKELGPPKGIVAVSAHWNSVEPRVTMHPSPPTIHDFGGFPDELYHLEYPAPGDPVLAKRVISLLKSGEIAAGMDMGRGYDHGAWAPLMLMYPEARIPLIQLSVQPRLGAEHHLAMGNALKPLRDEGILVLASGSATHNLRDFFGRALDAQAPPYVQEFMEWLKSAVSSNDTDELLHCLERAPHALQNHPTAEHFLPLFTAMGAGDKGRLLHDSYTYGVISMAAFAWE